MGTVIQAGHIFSGGTIVSIPPAGGDSTLYYLVSSHLPSDYAVYLYDSSGNELVRIPKPNDASDSWGNNIGTNDTKIAITDNTGNGALYIYDMDGSNMVKVTSSDASGNDRFGSQLEINSTKIIVGAPYAPLGSANYVGAVYVYDLDGTNEVKITASDGGYGDNFSGWAGLAVSESKIFVGSAYHDNGRGALYIYDMDGSNEVKVQPSDSAEGDQFAYVVSASETKVVATSAEKGAHGAAYIFDHDGTNEVKIEPSVDSRNNAFGGASAAINDTHVVISDRAFNGQKGAIYIYNIDGTNEVRIEHPSHFAPYDYFGFNLAMSSSKVFTCPPNDDDGGSSTGNVYEYNLDGTGERTLPTPSTFAAGSRFGQGLYIYDSSLVPSAPTFIAPSESVHVSSVVSPDWSSLTSSDFVELSSANWPDITNVETRAADSTDTHVVSYGKSDTGDWDIAINLNLSDGTLVKSFIVADDYPSVGHPWLSHCSINGNYITFTRGTTDITQSYVKIFDIRNIQQADHGLVNTMTYSDMQPEDVGVQAPRKAFTIDDNRVAMCYGQLWTTCHEVKIHNISDWSVVHSIDTTTGPSYDRSGAKEADLHKNVMAVGSGWDKSDTCGVTLINMDDYSTVDIKHDSNVHGILGASDAYFGSGLTISDNYVAFNHIRTHSTDDNTKASETVIHIHSLDGTYVRTLTPASNYYFRSLINLSLAVNSPEISGDFLIAPTFDHDWSNNMSSFSSAISVYDITSGNLISETVTYDGQRYTPQGSGLFGTTNMFVVSGNSVFDHSQWQGDIDNIPKVALLPITTTTTLPAFIAPPVPEPTNYFGATQVSDWTMFGSSTLSSPTDGTFRFTRVEGNGNVGQYVVTGLTGGASYVISATGDSSDNYVAEFTVLNIEWPDQDGSGPLDSGEGTVLSWTEAATNDVQSGTFTMPAGETSVTVRVRLAYEHNSFSGPDRAVWDFSDIKINDA